MSDHGKIWFSELTHKVWNHRLTDGELKCENSSSHDGGILPAVTTRRPRRAWLPEATANSNRSWGSLWLMWPRVDILHHFAKRGG
jgi:hypothetical protein